MTTNMIMCYVNGLNYANIGIFNGSNWLNFDSNGLYIGNSQTVPPNSSSYRLQVDGATYLNGAVLTSNITCSSETNTGTSTIAGLLSANGGITTTTQNITNGQLNFNYVSGSSPSNCVINFNTSGGRVITSPNCQILAIDDTAQYSGHLTFSTANPNAPGPTSALVERMRIKNNGNIGINQNNPAYTLDVNGTANFTGAMTCTSINTNNNNINCGTGSITCGSITCSSENDTGTLTVNGLLSANGGINTNNRNIIAGTGSVTCGSITSTGYNYNVTLNNGFVSLNGLSPTQFFGPLNLNTNGGGSVANCTIPAGCFKLFVDGAGKSDPNLMSSAEVITANNGNNSYVYNIANNGYFSWQSTPYGFKVSSPNLPSNYKTFYIYYLQLY